MPSSNTFICWGAFGWRFQVGKVAHAYVIQFPTCTAPNILSERHTAV